MDGALPSKQHEDDKQLLAALDRVLGSAMGVRVPFIDRPGKWAPFTAALAWLVFYAATWLTVDHFGGTTPSQSRLVTLIAWGGCYFAGALYLARSATSRLIETVRRDILPHASPGYAKAVTRELNLRFGPLQQYILPLLAASAAMVATWWAIEHDLKQGTGALFKGHPEFILFSLSYFGYFLTAGIAVVAARFYSSFAGNLRRESPFFYVMGAADTPLVKGLAKLGAQVLAFWALIFLLILSSMLLAFAPPDQFELTRNSRFLFLLVPVAGFFSLGFGSMIYLRTENRIRVTLQRFAYRQAGEMRERSNAIIDSEAGRCPDRDEEAAKALERLTQWHDRILAGGRYGSRAGATISIALPLILPLLTLLIKLIGG